MKHLLRRLALVALLALALGLSAHLYAAPAPCCQDCQPNYNSCVQSCPPGDQSCLDYCTLRLNSCWSVCVTCTWSHCESGSPGYCESQADCQGLYCDTEFTHCCI
jgi:hypothetical protein